jgi:predicted ATPase
MTDGAVREAKTLNHANSLAATLDAACGVVALSGDVQTLEEYDTLLADCAEEHNLVMWKDLALAFRAVAVVKGGDAALGLELLGSTFGGANLARVELRHTIFVEARTEALAATGRTNDGLALVQKLLDEALHNGGHWCVPELLRLRGELRLGEDRSAASATARDDFAQAMGLSERQGALSWRLRAATSMARLLHRQHGHVEARAVLSPIYNGFTEGFETADLTAAKALLSELE